MYKVFMSWLSIFTYLSAASFFIVLTYASFIMSHEESRRRRQERLHK